MGFRTVIFRALRMIGLLTFFGWWVFQVATAWIGRATAPEDTQVVQDRFAQFVDWLLSTPGWVPGSLAIVFGLVVLAPNASWTAIRAMRGKLPPDVKPETMEAVSPIKIDARNEPQETTDVGPFVGGLLGGPISSSAIGALSNVSPTPAPPRVDPETEHEDKKKAKFALRASAEDHFEPTYLAAIKFRAKVVDTLLYSFPQGPVRDAVSLGCRDYCILEFRDSWLSWVDIQKADKIRRVSLHKVETSYYQAFLEYSRNLDLAFAMLTDPNQQRSVPVLQDIRSLHDSWRPLHDAMIVHNAALKREFPDLHTVHKMHTMNNFSVPEIDWSKLNQR